MNVKLEWPTMQVEHEEVVGVYLRALMDLATSLFIVLLLLLLCAAAPVPSRSGSTLATDRQDDRSIDQVLNEGTPTEGSIKERVRSGMSVSKSSCDGTDRRVIGRSLAGTPLQRAMTRHLQLVKELCRAKMVDMCARFDPWAQELQGSKGVGRGNMCVEEPATTAR